MYPLERNRWKPHTDELMPPLCGEVPLALMASPSGALSFSSKAAA